MSCPYLEKGRIAYCHAFGGEGIEVRKTDIEGVCFSGEFGECSFLFSPVSGEYRKSREQKNIERGLFNNSFLGNKTSTVRGINRG
jgi:hypothetical protein